ncbi:MAG: glutamine-synthetase adenylyltransferase [Pseudomonadota bacterium]
MPKDLSVNKIPRPFNRERGAETAALVPSVAGDGRKLIEGAAGCSPYLAGLIAKEAEWLAHAMADPDAAITAAIEGAGRLLVDVPNGLRRAKRRVALLTALCDLGGAWSLDDVTRHLTDFADVACGAALRDALRPLLIRGKIPGMDETDLDTACGISVLAMGKMGAGELNYSSDIDLICLFDELRFDAEDFGEARMALVKAVRKMCATLSDITAEGYVFRTDLRLRPDPSVTPVVLSMEAAERYYESLGRTWERAAYIKARACAGDVTAGERFLHTLRPFVWRRHLDFAAVEDAHTMRVAIREHKKLAGPITLPGHDMKLGRGGIREIEFFTQTRQLIAGGRDESLRVRGTVEGLERLARANWVPQSIADAFADHYRFHRTVEHRVQMMRDAQTHTLPKSDEEFDRLAAMMDRDVADLKKELRMRLEAVHAEADSFFAPVRDGPDPADAVDPAMLARWRTYPALRSERSAHLFERIKPRLLGRLADLPRRAEALAALDGFLAGLPAGVQLFSLFDANPQLIDLLVDIVSTSPQLAQYLSRNASVLDAVIGGEFFAPWPGQSALAAGLVGKLEQEGDYERQLDISRRWAREWHFRIGVHFLRGLIGAEEAGMQYADLAKATLAGLWPRVEAEFAAKHGPPPGRGAAILGMGSLGAGSLTAASDLDVIVIYDPEDVQQSDGRRPLPVQQYYARLTKALITAMTAQTAEGRLYEVDMRLRPSGNQGPVATSWAAFQTYQQNDAWLWEHMALCRAHVIVGPVALGEEIERLRRSLIAAPRDRATVLAEVSAMRGRISAAKTPSGVWDAKIGPGRLQDIELLAQAGLLLSGSVSRDTVDGLQALGALGLVPEKDGKTLRDTFALCQNMRLAAALLGADPLDPDALGESGQMVLCRATGAETLEEAGQRALNAYNGAAAAIETALGREA